jgi:hypothetical protein
VNRSRELLSSFQRQVDTNDELASKNAGVRERSGTGGS